MLERLDRLFHLLVVPLLAVASLVLLVEHEHVRVVRAVVHGVHAVVDRGHLEVLVDVEVLLAVDDLGLDELLALHLDLDGRRHRVEQEPAGRVEGEASVPRVLIDSRICLYIY